MAYYTYVFLKLIRVKQYLMATIVTVAYLTAIQKPIILDPLLFILTVSLVFGVVFYGACYILNDLKDAKQDRLHPEKKVRSVIAAGIVKPKTAMYIMLILFITSFISASIFSTTLFYYQILFLIFNIIYSVFAKGIPYIELVAELPTKPLRIMLGITLAGSSIYLFRDLLITSILISISCAAFRRYKEFIKNKNKYRKSLAGYNKNILLGIIIVPAAISLIHFILTFEAPGLILRLLSFSTLLVLNLKFKIDKKV